MSDELVTLLYVGPLASGTLEPYYANGQTWPIAHGQTVTVPAWIANGHPGEPGAYDAGNGPEPFTKYSEVPPGAALLQDCIAPLPGLLAEQPDNFQLPPKTARKSKTDDEDGEPS